MTLCPHLSKEIDMEELNTFLCTVNKNIQGMAGINLVIANNNSLEKIKNFEKEICIWICILSTFFRKTDNSDLHLPYNVFTLKSSS